MSHWRNILIKPETSILDTLRVIDDSSLAIALVVDHEEKLIGTVTDGDIRRALLKGHPLTLPAREIMNLHPISAGQHTPEEELLFMLSRHSIKHLPVTDSAGRVVGLRQLQDLIQRQQRENWAVIMAGGRGTRLGELTRSTPKPLLTVGDRPLLGTILTRLRRHGIRRVFLAVNHLADQVKTYVGDGSAFDLEVSCLEEREVLGTAGALGLLPEKPALPLIVMNGDLLTSVHFGNLLDFHTASHRALTVCIRECRFQVPYGVVTARGNDLIDIIEKPEQEVFINAGIYILNPEVLERIVPGTKIDMPDLIKKMTGEKGGVGCFPLGSFWMDIGRPDDFLRAQSEYQQHFSESTEVRP
ncbi:MAG TPA: nucleotidyltransferase family protein [Candidatus Ozemobacteraceae bacterium]|nr:nucleotidyltransferase family protein [Candidatus Ozemobacteraceae bacterium]